MSRGQARGAGLHGLLNETSAATAGRGGGGWTGGQYSVYRVALALGIAGLLGERLARVSDLPAALLSLGIAGCVLLALGWRDTAVSCLLFGLVASVAALVDGAPLVLPGAGVSLSGMLLILHIAVPPGPFGCWEARGRIDPRGGWVRPRWIGDAAWALASGVLLVRGLARIANLTTTPAELDFAGLAAVGVVIQLAFAATLFRRSLRRTAWLVMLLWRIAWISAFGPAPGESILFLLLIFAAEPGWWPGRSLFRSADAEPGLQPAMLYYDGDCGFCHRSVRFVLSEELATPESLRMRFAPLSSEHFRDHIAAREDVDTDRLPDSIVLLLEDGQLLTRSAAALEIASRLGGLWRGIALLARLLPQSLLDRAYDGVARIRKRIFRAPSDSCPILPPDLRARFAS